MLLELSQQPKISETEKTLSKNLNIKQLFKAIKVLITKKDHYYSNLAKFLL